MTKINSEENHNWYKSAIGAAFVAGVTAVGAAACAKPDMVASIVGQQALDNMFAVAGMAKDGAQLMVKTAGEYGSAAAAKTTELYRVFQWDKAERVAHLFYKRTAFADYMGGVASQLSAAHHLSEAIDGFQRVIEGPSEIAVSMEELKNEQTLRLAMIGLAKTRAVSKSLSEFVSQSAAISQFQTFVSQLKDAIDIRDAQAYEAGETLATIGQAVQDYQTALKQAYGTATQIVQGFKEFEVQSAAISQFQTLVSQLKEAIDIRDVEAYEAGETLATIGQAAQDYQAALKQILEAAEQEMAAGFTELYNSEQVKRMDLILGNIFSATNEWVTARTDFLETLRNNGMAG